VNTTNTATNSNRFNESLTYDIRGNINALQRQGYYASTCGFDQIDNLTYTYTPNTNRIASIADNAPLSQRSQGFNPGSGGVGYTYDANGNLKSDSYKGISTIFYNHLNLPSLINFTSGNSIEYKYDAGGNKLRKTVKVGATVQYEQYYVGGVEYRKTGTGNTRIEAIYHSEGRYANTDLDIDDSPNWRKEYNIKDHLGNTRLSFADKNGNGVVDITNTPATNDILQESHYYPFGLSYEGPWLMNDAARDNKYQFNSIEFNEDFGLNIYTAEFRGYDPAIGRWWQIDPKYSYPISPYSGFGNNPIRYMDMLGDTLRGANEKSAQRALSIIRNTFNSMGKSGNTVAKLFQLGTDGKTFSSINAGLLLRGIAGLSKEGQALAIGYFIAVNQEATNVIEVVTRNENISTYGRNLMYGKESSGRTGVDIDADFGGGNSANVYQEDGIVNIIRGGNYGTYASIVMDSKYKSKFMMYSNGSHGPSLPGELLAHELLGHGLGSRYSFTDGKDEAVQAGNLYLRASGKNYYRPGHGVRPDTEHFNPNGIPPHLNSGNVYKYIR